MEVQYDKMTAWNLLVSSEEKLGLLAEGHYIDVAPLVVEPVQPQLPVLDDPNGFGHLVKVGHVGGVSDRVVNSNQD